MDETEENKTRFLRRIQRCEELRQELEQKSATRRAYALQALLSLLWVEEGALLHAVAEALCGHPPHIGKGETPRCAVRLCVLLSREEDTLAPPPPTEHLISWAGKAVAAVLQESLDTLKAVLRASSCPNATLVRREAAVCRDAFSLAQHLGTADMAEPALRLLRMLPPEQVRETGSLARETADLRDAACRTLGALSPEALYTLWLYLGGPDAEIRRNLLQVLDYIHDPRAIPNLTRLLERRFQWEDGGLIAWYVVRAFERMGDRSALPALRRIAEGGSGLRLALPWLRVANAMHTSPELALQARRVIQDIESHRESRDRQLLLRASSPAKSQLLRPAAEEISASDHTELLLPHEIHHERTDDR